MLAHWLSEVASQAANATIVPDVHDPEAHANFIYGIDGSTYIGNERLAWEFLRRSRVFRQEFFTFLSRWQSIHAAGEGHPERPSFLSEQEAFCDRWGLWNLWGPPHPDSPNQPSFKNLDGAKSLPPHALFVDGRNVDLTHGNYADYSPTISVRFFLDSHIANHIEHFRKWVSSPDFAKWLAHGYGVSLEPTETTPKRRDDKYSVYLRILDAQAQGMNDREIGWLIHGQGSKPSVTELRKDIARANEIADIDYQSIQRLRPFSEKPGK